MSEIITNLNGSKTEEGLIVLTPEEYEELAADILRRAAAGFEKILVKARFVAEATEDTLPHALESLREGFAELTGEDDGNTG